MREEGEREREKKKRDGKMRGAKVFFAATEGEKGRERKRSFLATKSSVGMASFFAPSSLFPVSPLLACSNGTKLTALGFFSRKTNCQKGEKRAQNGSSFSSMISVSICSDTVSYFQLKGGGGGERSFDYPNGKSHLL